jgi:hypothetical protein
MMVDLQSGQATELVYFSTYLYEVDLVAEQFELAGIPFHRAIENPGGERFQMAAAVPAACMPGSRFIILVPERYGARARKLVASLPVSR